MARKPNVVNITPPKLEPDAVVESGKQIDELIKQVPGAYAKAHDIVQEAAVAIVRHAYNFGDCSRALILVRTIPIQQARSLITYFMTVSPIGVRLSENAKDDKVRFISKDSKSYKDFDIEKAKSLKWWTLDTIAAERNAIDVFAGGLYDDVIRMLERTIKNDGTARHYTDDAVSAAKHLKSLIEADRPKFLAAMGASSKANENDEKPKNDEQTMTKNKGGRPRKAA